MVKHIILWTLKETDADKKAEILANMKEHLEGLAGKVPGLLEVHVRTNPLASSNAEVMLDTTLENEEMLKGYQKHRERVCQDDFCKFSKFKYLSAEKTPNISCRHIS